MKPILRTRLFGVVIQLYAIAALTALSERLGNGVVNPPVAVAAGFAVGLANVLWWSRQR